MLFYGMAIPDNPHDVVPIQLQVRYQSTSSDTASLHVKGPLAWQH